MRPGHHWHALQQRHFYMPCLRMAALPFLSVFCSLGLVLIGRKRKEMKVAKNPLRRKLAPRASGLKVGHKKLSARAKQGTKNAQIKGLILLKCIMKKMECMEKKMQKMEFPGACSRSGSDPSKIGGKVEGEPSTKICIAKMTGRMTSPTPSPTTMKKTEEGTSETKNLSANI